MLVLTSGVAAMLTNAGKMPALPGLQILFNLADDLANLERAALNFRKRNRINQILRPNHGAELAQVHLRDNHSFKPGQHFTEIFWEGIQVLQVRRRNALALAL